MKLIFARKVLHLASFWKWEFWNSAMAYTRLQPKLYFHILFFLLFFWCSLKWVIRIVYFPIPYNTLSLPLNFCVSYCFQVLLEGLHIPRCIWKHIYCGDLKIVNYIFILYIEPFRLVCFVFPIQTMWCSQSRMSFFLFYKLSGIIHVDRTTFEKKIVWQ